jgi:hypothetical protein
VRLFGKANGSIDRFDRAEWLTPPFDLDLRAVAPGHGGVARRVKVRRLVWEFLYGTVTVVIPPPLVTARGVVRNPPEKRKKLPAPMLPVVSAKQSATRRRIRDEDEMLILMD